SGAGRRGCRRAAPRRDRSPGQRCSNPSRHRAAGRRARHGPRHGVLAHRESRVYLRPGGERVSSMRWVTYASPTLGADRPGLVRDDVIHGLGEPPTLVGLLSDDATLMGPAERALASPIEVVPLAGAELRAPVPLPPSIR